MHLNIGYGIEVGAGCLFEDTWFRGQMQLLPLLLFLKLLLL